LLEHVSSHPLCSPATKEICLKELGSVPLHAFYRDQVRSNQVIPSGIINTILPERGDANYVPVPLLGNSSVLLGPVVKSLEISMNKEKLTLEPGNTSRPVKQLLSMVGDAITSNNLNETAAYQLLANVSKPDLSSVIYDLKESETPFKDGWEHIVSVISSTVGKSSCEQDLKVLLRQRPASLALAMGKIRTLCRRLVANEDPETREQRHTSECLRWGKKLIALHYRHYYQHIEHLFQADKDRLKVVKTLGSAYQTNDSVRNEFNRYIEISCNYISTFMNMDLGDREFPRSKAYAAKVSQDTEEGADPDSLGYEDTNTDSDDDYAVEAAVSKTTSNNQHRREDQRKNRDKSKERNRRDRRNSRSRERRDEKKDQKSNAHVLTCTGEPLMNMQAYMAQVPVMQPNVPYQPRMGMPSHHPVMLPQNFMPRPYQPRYPQNGQVIRVKSDPNLHCQNCNLQGHSYTTCFKYKDTPGTVQCQNCFGFHKGECKRPLGVTSFRPQPQGFQNQQNQTSQGVSQPSNQTRMPFNGIANNGVQSLPATEANIQRRNGSGQPFANQNTMRGNVPQQQQKSASQNVQIHVAHTLGSEGSGYHFSGMPGFNQVSDQDIDQISVVTEEELAADQEDIGFLLQHGDDASQDGSNVMYHNYPSA
jgi:hypothetical protein